MKKFKNVIIVMAVLSAMSAQAMDIVGGKSDSFIKVETKGEMRKFSLCSVKAKVCNGLGNNRWFSVSDLAEQRIVEQGQAALSTVETVGAIVVGLYGGAYFSALYIAGANTPMIVGGVVGAGSGLVESITSLGPIEQFKQQYLLRSEVINDGSVILDSADDSEIREIANRLDLLLGKL